MGRQLCCYLGWRNGNRVVEISESNIAESKEKAYGLVNSGYAKKVSDLTYGLFRIELYFTKNYYDISYASGQETRYWQAKARVNFILDNSFDGFKCEKIETAFRIAGEMQVDFTFNYRVEPNADLEKLILDIENNLLAKNISYETDPPRNIYMFVERDSQDFWYSEHSIRLREFVLGEEKAVEFKARALTILVIRLALAAKEQTIILNRDLGIFRSLSGAAMRERDAAHLDFSNNHEPWFMVACGAISESLGKPNWRFKFSKGEPEDTIAKELFEAAGLDIDTFTAAKENAQVQSAGNNPIVYDLRELDLAVRAVEWFSGGVLSRANNRELDSGL